MAITTATANRDMETWEERWWKKHYGNDDEEATNRRAIILGGPDTTNALYRTKRHVMEDVGYDRSPLYYEDGRGQVVLYSPERAATARQEEEEEKATATGRMAHATPYLSDYRKAKMRYGHARVRSYEHWTRTREDLLKRGMTLPRHFMVRNAVAALKELSGCVEVLLAIKLNPLSPRATLFRVDVGYEGWYRDLCIATCAIVSEKLGGRELSINDVRLTKNGVTLDVLKRDCGCDCLKKHSYVEVSFSSFDLPLEIQKIRLGENASTRALASPFPLPERFARYSPKRTKEFSRFCLAVVELFWVKCSELIWPSFRGGEGSSPPSGAAPENLQFYAKAQAYLETGETAFTEVLQACIRECLPRKYPRFEEFCNVHSCDPGDFFERLRAVCFDMVRIFVETHGQEISFYDQLYVTKTNRELFLQTNERLLQSEIQPLLPLSPPHPNYSAGALKINAQLAPSSLVDDGIMETIANARSKVSESKTLLAKEPMERGKIMHSAFEGMKANVCHSIEKCHAELVQAYRNNERLSDFLRDNKSELRVGSQVLSDLRSAHNASRSSSSPSPITASLSDTAKIAIMSALPSLVVKKQSPSSPSLQQQQQSKKIPAKVENDNNNKDNDDSKPVSKDDRLDRAFIRGTIAYNKQKKQRNENNGESKIANPLRVETTPGGDDDDYDNDDTMMRYIQKRRAPSSQNQPQRQLLQQQQRADAFVPETSAVDVRMPWKKKKKGDDDDDKGKKKGEKKKKTKTVDAAAIAGNGSGSLVSHKVSYGTAEEQLTDRLESQPDLLPPYESIPRDERRNFFIATFGRIKRHATGTTAVHKVLVFFEPSNTVTSAADIRSVALHFDRRNALVAVSLDGNPMVSIPSGLTVSFFPTSGREGGLIVEKAAGLRGGGGGGSASILLDTFLVQDPKAGTVVKESWRFGVASPVLDDDGELEALFSLLRDAASM